MTYVTKTPIGLGCLLSVQVFDTTVYNTSRHAHVCYNLHQYNRWLGAFADRMCLCN